MHDQCDTGQQGSFGRCFGTIVRKSAFTFENEIMDVESMKDANKSVILPFEKQGDYYVEDLGELKGKLVYRFLKRAFDIIFSLTALLVLALPMLIIALLVRMDSKGMPVYFQERLGLGGKKFRIVKFRTMYVDAESTSVQWSLGDEDERITRVGKFLRKTRLDEIPQFWCVLKGDMSLIGPRPEREVFYNEFEKYIHGFSERLKVRPGISGLAQINGGYNLKPEEKIVYDIEYIKNRSVWLDIKIVFGTVRVMVGRKDAK